ncbi:hypothetical protein LSH36_39g12004, partial [Paralvinella palmiformis]
YKPTHARTHINIYIYIYTHECRSTNKQTNPLTHNFHEEHILSDSKHPIFVIIHHPSLTKGHPI